MLLNYLPAFLFFVLLGTHLTYCLNILVIFGHAGKSHYDVFSNFFTVLAEKGHNMTIISHVYIQNRENIRHVPLSDNKPMLHVIDLGITGRHRFLDYYYQPKLISDFANENCPKDLQYPDFQQFLKEDHQFDIILGEMFNTNCNFGLISKYNAPFVVLMPYDGWSHFAVFSQLFETLGERGHNLTVISFSRAISRAQNIQSVWLGREEKMFSIALPESGSKIRFYLAPILLRDMSDKFCEYGLQHEDFRGFLRDSKNFTFDIIMAELFVTDCFLGIANLYDAPLIGLSSCVYMPWHADWFGVPSNPSYIQNIFGGYPEPMSFISRVENTLLLLYVKLWYKLAMEKPGYEWSKKYIGYEAADPYNASLILVNSHYTLNGVKPLTPSVIEVGGIHTHNKKPKKLPEDIERWINNSDAGVIYFSLGSMIKGDTFPEEQRRAFLRAFAKLPQRVLWKWENDTMPDKPDNVMIDKWFPQFDILSHPNVKLFISHGGLLGTIEAVQCGIPIIVMPQFGDQRHNAYAIENKGVGVILHLQSATEEKVSEALKKGLDPQTFKNAKTLSEKFRDRPMSPMDTAVYWVEHVARHKGALHMRSPAIDLPFYQYYLLDVIAFLVLVVLVLFYIFYKTARLILSLVIFKTKKTKLKVS